MQTYKEFVEEQLKFGVKYEKLAQGHIIRYIKENHDKIYKLKSEREDGEFDFDLIHKESENIVSFEVKTDRSSRRTNNYYIEYNNGFGKPSGIEITKAHYHIITDEIDFYLIQTQILKDIIANGSWRKLATYKKFLKNEKPITQITSYGYIIPKDEIIQQAKRIN